MWGVFESGSELPHSKAPCGRINDAALRKTTEFEFLETVSEAPIHMY
jgi:hypothetical protein